MGATISQRPSRLHAFVFFRASRNLILLHFRRALGSTKHRHSDGCNDSEWSAQKSCPQRSLGHGDGVDSKVRTNFHHFSRGINKKSGKCLKVSIKIFVNNVFILIFLLKAQPITVNILIALLTLNN